MNMSVVQLWLLVGISATLFAAFVIVTILVLLDLVGVVRLPEDVSKPLRSTLIVQFAVIAIGAMGALLAPNAIEGALNQVAREVSPTSVVNPPTEGPPEPVQTADATASVTCGTTDKAPLIYVQFPSEAQRSQAQAIQANAQAAGWLSPGIELVEAYSRPETQLRYFRDDERDDAQAVAAQLVADGNLPGDTKVMMVPSNVRRCQFEVWIGNAS